MGFNSAFKGLMSVPNGGEWSDSRLIRLNLGESPLLLIRREACCTAESIWELWVKYKFLVPSQSRT